MTKEYVNEHILKLYMCMHRNLVVQGQKVPELRDEFNSLLEHYNYLLNEQKFHKKNAEVQKTFGQLLEISVQLYPTQQEMAELYDMFTEISKRCVNIYGKKRGFDYKEISGICWERWSRYCNNFDPFKVSEISGKKINAFAYTTQIIKNIIFEFTNLENKQLNVKTAIIQDLGSLEEEDHCYEFDDNFDDEIVAIIKSQLPKYNDLKTALLSISKENDLEPELIIQAILNHNELDNLKQMLNSSKWEF